MNNTLNSYLPTIMRQFIWFGKEQHTRKVCGKVRAKINVQPTSLARSQTKRRGRKATLKGRPHKDVSSVSDLVWDVSGAIIPAQPMSKKRKPAAKHSFKDALEKNKPSPRRHRKQ